MLQGVDETGLHNAVHPLDYLLFAEKLGSGNCTYLLKVFHDLAECLGVPLDTQKTEGPTKANIYLGIELDTVQSVSLLSREKLDIVRAFIMQSMGPKGYTQRVKVVMLHLSFTCP